MTPFTTHHSPFTTHPFFGGASPNFVPALAINSSNRLRALGQVLSLKGTAQPPLPLQSFWPGCSPQPPWHLQSFMPLQSCAATVARWAWSAASLVVPGLPLFLQVLMARQPWGSFNNRLALSSAPALGVFAACGLPPPAGLLVQPTTAPVRRPPSAASVKRFTSRRFKVGSFMKSPCQVMDRLAPGPNQVGVSRRRRRANGRAGRRRSCLPLTEAPRGLRSL